MVKFFKIIGTVFIGLYLVLCISLYFGQEKIIFNPDKLPENHQFRAGEEVEVEVAAGIFLNNLHLRSPQSRGVILYFHGNKGSNRRCLRQANTMEGNGYDIFMPDYRGYGKSDGILNSEKEMLSDAQKIYDYLKTKYEESKIVIVGYSLGTGPASFLAANNNPQQLILNSPFISFNDLKDRRFPLIPDWLIKYPLKNIDFLKKVKSAVTIFHGTRDEVIPFDSSERLKEVNSNIVLIPLKDTSHRRAIFHDLFEKRVSQLLF